MNDDVAEVIGEYRDAAGEVLDSFGTGPMVRTGGWVTVSGEHPAPAGTASARLRLIAERGTGTTVRVGFDGLALRSLGVPVLWADDVAIVEGDPRGEARFHLRLSCAAPFAFSLPYTTVDETATAGADYAATSGVAAFAAGDMLHEVVVPILDDSEIDPGESFVVAFDPAGL
ncbi:MAG: hypothetical protein GY837_16700, partial [Bosea sp.]|uniref:Calx-beta domain-containing protein n=1 Tax=Bosea sp. (in: a-proteobacteria) TaxID=1871050 RepID=UPI0031FE659E|nr:hypothetical protein [Bosea sp. (in: a-proteobacteria)]